MSGNDSGMDSIAIIGMAGRFPKAANIDEFWRNLCSGTEGISFFTDAELAAVSGAAPVNNSRLVKARGVLENAEFFDAAFFGVKPKEAEVMDPQHRVFLECAWEALEDAGQVPEKCGGAIGVYAGMSMNTYLPANLATHPNLMEMVGEYQLMLGNDKDFLPTRTSYKLNLKGPSLNIQTACSTSLVAVCVACQQLLDHQCDMALAGAVSISFPQKRGYLFQEGGIASPDGHCRAFDAQAAGTVAGEGVGIVVLKRLAEAVADGDQIYAVIKGFALNNDGSLKIGYTAPSVEGQAEVIAMAQGMAGVEPRSIGYVEAHGTGTPLGDPIEIEGLTRAFRVGTRDNGFCALGSVKSSIGHLDVAAGVAGLIKTALALRHRQLPPSLHFTAPNPKIDFTKSPFHVNARITDWARGEYPRRAGVSSFGIGGTNAHVVLEEAPELVAKSDSRPAQLLLLSAKTESALNQAAANLANRLRELPEVSLADAAFTLQTGRHDFPHRRMLVCRDVGDAAQALSVSDVRRVLTRTAEGNNPPVVFMFPGQGAQQVNMGQELYRHEPVFRAEVDRCAEILKPHLGLDLRNVLYPAADQLQQARQQLNWTAITQPALFVIEYALAMLWMSWGIEPESMIGHSLGEYVAACLAGVFPLETGLKLIATRGWMMQQMPPGGMLAVRLAEAEVRPLLNANLAVAAVNATSLCVISGPADAVEEFRRQLELRNIPGTLLQTSHAFHSAMMEPILKPFAEIVMKADLQPPKIRFISNVTGKWITAAEATDPAYWVSHLRHTVRFADGVGELFKLPERQLLEVGPGHTLTALAKQHPARSPNSLVLASIAQCKAAPAEMDALLMTLGQLWLAGVSVQWKGFYAHEHRRRVRLPAYPFERRRFWIEPARSVAQVRESSSEPRIAAEEEASIEIEESGNSNTIEPVDENGVPHSRKTKILKELRELIAGLSGASLAGIASTATFAEMGFESLFLTQVSLALEKRFSVPVAFRQLLEDLASLEALAEHLDSAMPPDKSGLPPRVDLPAAGDQVEPVSEKNAVEQLLPLTESQRELWFASQISDAASCAYNESRLLHMRGAVQVDAMQSAIQKLVDRHEALRTNFAASGELQRIRLELNIAAALLDWSTLDQAEQARKLDDLQHREAGQPFDLVNGPLLRVRLIQLGREQFILILTVHHIICDGHSLGILLRELAGFYSAACRGSTAALAAPLQISEFVQARPRGADASAAEKYWLAQFVPGAPALELPVDHLRPPVWTFNGASVRVTLPAALRQVIRRVATQKGSTMFTTLLASWLLLLRRLTGQADIVVGIPIADRAMERGGSLVGHCVNFLPLRAIINDETPFGDHLANVQKLFLDAHEHQGFTFGSLLQKLNLSRDPGRMPLVSTTFNVERLSEPLSFFGLEVELEANPHSFTNFDLSFNATEIDDALQIDFRYNAALFEASTVQRWLSHFQTLLAGVAGTAEQRVSKLPILSPEEAHLILTEWNDTQSSYPQDTCLHDLVAGQVSRTPQAIALVDAERRLTYCELNRRADRLARRLCQLGIGPDVPVAVCAERSAELVIALLATLKAGGCYVPMDPRYPKDRIAFMLEDAQASVLLSQRGLVAGLPANDATVICLDEFDWEQDGESSEVHGPVRSTNLAYVIYTSGSTGRPKGVAIEHRNAVNLVHWARELFTPQELAGVLFSTSICFDLSVFEIFTPLITGGRIILAENALALADLPARDEVTLINTVPSAIAELLRLKAIPPSVGTVCLAGEPLKASAVDRLYALGTIQRVYDLYGPSETTTYSTCALRQPGSPATIGRPIANTQIFILDSGLAPAPIGVTGEVYIGGDGLARGYVRRPDLTAERFVPSPFDGPSTARIYRTGDLARWYPDGSIEFLGRADHQVKIRGHRIELGEIETHLLQQPAIRECVVLAREDTPGEKRLVAYVKLEQDVAASTITEMRDGLARKLPDYMIPSAFVVLESLPLTPNGKVDRRALRAPDESQAAAGSALYAAPTKITEEILVQIWRDVLGLNTVGIHDDFFELGGHSLLATQVISRVRDTFLIDLPMRRFFEHPTVAALGSVIEELLFEEIRGLSDEEARRVVGSAH